MSKEILRDSERMYSLICTDAGDLYIEVVTGGFAMDICKMFLTAEEIRQFEEEGKDYLDDLAYRVSRQENAYKFRLMWDD